MNNNKILEIGSNDGAFSFNFDKKKIICVEPCGNLAKITKKKVTKLIMSIGILDCRIRYTGNMEK
jgi:hypothetical protein